MEPTVRMNEHLMVARTAAAGSMVLLKNIRGTLPLLPVEGADALPVAVFGVGQLRTTLTAGTTPWRTVNILDGLTACQTLTPDGLLQHKYRNFVLNHPEGGAELPIQTLSMEELAEQNQAAIIVISRPYQNYDIALTNAEEELICTVAAAFPRSVLVLNTPGYMDIAVQSKLVGAVVFMGIAGQEGGHALADLLTGRTIPMGKLADTWPVDPALFEKQNRYTDLYVGYRYYDSFGKDVLYPFGHGLTYGKAVLGSYSVGLDGSNVTVEAEIENVGTVYPVREVVQVYFSTPDDVVSRPVYVLDCFSKTRLLEPGESQTMKLSFPVTEMCRFDDTTSSYILDAGYYDIRVGTNSRNTTIAGSIFVPKAAVCQQLRPCCEKAEVTIRPRKGRSAFTYPGEEEERNGARKQAIRFSLRQLRTTEVVYSKKFGGCRGGKPGLRLEDVAAGQYDLRQLVAGMSDHDLRALVCNFVGSAAKVPGAYGASADLTAEYGIVPLTICKGCDGAHVTKDLRNEEGEVTGHQYATAFPVPSLLACSFDPEILERVGGAIGRELQEFGADLWLGASASLHRDPRSSCHHAAFSEDPIVAGLCAAWMIRGCQKYTMAALRHIEHNVELQMTERTLRDLDLLSFFVAIYKGKPAAVMAPSIAVCGEALSLDNRILSDVLYDEWGYQGMAFASGELFARFPPRPLLEQAALRTLQVIAQSRTFQARKKMG